MANRPRIARFTAAQALRLILDTFGDRVGTFMTLGIYFLRTIFPKFLDFVKGNMKMPYLITLDDAQIY